MGQQVKVGTGTESGPSGAEIRRETLFEERYGSGSYQRLLALLQRPCVTFAQIADRYSVTRERVRQWHLLLLPAAPGGRERRRQCALMRQRQRLLRDGLFSAFVRHARERAPDARVEPVTTASGYRTRLGRIDGRLVALRDASRTAMPQDDPHATSYRLVGYRGDAELVYYMLSAEVFLVVPVKELSLYGATFVDDGTDRYEPFKNCFRILDSGEKPLSPDPSQGKLPAG